MLTMFKIETHINIPAYPIAKSFGFNTAISFDKYLRIGKCAILLKYVEDICQQELNECKNKRYKELKFHLPYIPSLT